jgi:3-oxoacyl-[acyl-carrier protein] reductase
LITGTSKGIGRFLAEHFLTNGAIVEGCSRQAVDWECDNYTHHLADVTDEQQVKSMLASIWQRHRRLDVLINNAGVAAMNHVMLTPTDTIRRILEINVAGTVLMCRESAKLMRRRNYGRIVNLGSVASPMKLAGEAVYAASKSAVVTFSQILAFELADFGITCNVVGPSPIETDLIRSVPSEKIQQLVDNLAVHRTGQYEDVAHVVDFFVHPRSNYVTGQVIYLGGVA